MIKNETRHTDAGLFEALSLMMRQDGKTPPPTVEAYKAALSWWHGLTDSERQLWEDLGLKHVRDWWTLQAEWLRHCRAIDPELAHVVFGIVFEHATVLTDIGGLNWAKQKSYGAITGIRLLNESDGYYVDRISVQHHQSSPWHQKWSQRNLLKEYLPGRLRTVINQSRSMTWQVFAAKCAGGWVRESSTVFDDIAPSIVETIRSAIHDPERTRVVSVKHTNGGEALTLTFERMAEADDRWQAASRKLCRQFGWTLKQLWRHIGGKDLLPANVIFDERPLPDATGRRQATLFDE